MHPAENPRVALVTGGSRGIGRGIARRLANDGFLVGVHYGSNEGAARETVAMIEGAGGHGFIIGQELGVTGDIESLFERFDEQLRAKGGPVRLDVMVNNAGIAIEDGIEGLTPQTYESQFAVNTRAPLFATQAAVRRMSAGGRIISISSATTRRAMPEWLVYTMTKSAIETMTRIVAQELAPRGITANAVGVGVVDTDMNASWLDDDEQREAAASIASLGRIGEPADIADIVAFLASDQARWVTGQIIDGSGGSFL